MRFMTRALIGLVATVLTVAFIGAAVFAVMQALEARMERGGHAPRRQERVQAVRTITLRPARLAPVVRGHGRIEARREVVLKARAGGAVAAVLPAFAAGRPVKQGEVLVRLDAREAEARLAQARVDLRDAEAETAAAERALVLARKDLETARQQAALRERAFERQKGLIARGATTEAALEQAELAAVQAREAQVARERALAEAEARLARAKVMVERRRIALTLARKALEDTRVIAPMDGLPDGVTVTEGATVAPGERLGRLFDPQALEAVFTVSLADHARLSGADGTALGRPLSILLELGAQRAVFPGRIMREAPVAESTSGGRRLHAEVTGAAEGVPARLKPGDFVRLEIRGPAIASAARIPATAIGTDGTVLALGADGRLEAVTVRIVHREGNTVLIAVPPGLAGRRIVAVRTPLLAPGVKVKPIVVGEAASNRAPGTQAGFGLRAPRSVGEAVGEQDEAAAPEVPVRSGGGASGGNVEGGGHEGGASGAPSAPAADAPPVSGRPADGAAGSGAVR